VKGAVKDTAGKVTGDKKLQAEGKLDKAKGSVHNVAGDVKDAARDASKTADAISILTLDVAAALLPPCRAAFLFPTSPGIPTCRAARERDVPLPKFAMPRRWPTMNEKIPIPCETCHGTGLIAGSECACVPGCGGN
jgi:uncharacterized protein YjbJ (UPF0337 family)